jgi:hypothetical protein
MHLGFGDVDGGINAMEANDLGGVVGGRSGGGGGGVVRGGFHAETAARPATSDAVAKRTSVCFSLERGEGDGACARERSLGGGLLTTPSSNPTLRE